MLKTARRKKATTEYAVEFRTQDGIWHRGDIVFDKASEAIDVAERGEKAVGLEYRAVKVRK